MKSYTLLLLLLLPVVSFSGERTYRCTIEQILELSDNGMMEKHAGVYERLIGKQFSVNRETGEMSGLPFATKPYAKVTVLDNGGSGNSYKAIVTSHPPNMWVMYIYVAEQHGGRKKPFWGADDGDKIYSGLCE